MSQYYDQQMRDFENEEPRQVDGAWTCEDCEESIEPDAPCYTLRIDGVTRHWCAECMRSHLESAPYPEEVYFD